MLKIHALLLLAVALTAEASAADAGANAAQDPYLWLEAVEDEAALDWVRERNARSLPELEDMPVFAAMHREALAILTAQARIPYGEIRAGHVFNFWQDEDHVRGILRRATLASYRRGEPEWQTLIDVDALDAAEQQNWVYKDYLCLPPEHEHCLIELSRGGTDASVFREFSASGRRLVPAGFEVPEAKSFLAWWGPDTLLVATDWGPGSLTESGYPRVLKVWRRGKPLEAAETVFTGEPGDVLVAPVVYRDDATTYAMVIRGVTFFESEYYLIGAADAPRRLPLPPRSSVYGVVGGRLIAKLEEDWRHGETTFDQGAVVALKLDDFSAGLVYAPAAGEAVRNVHTGSGAVFVELLENVVGAARRVTLAGQRWQARRIPLPGNGVVTITSVDHEDDALLVSFESLTVPDTLFYVTAADELDEVFALPPMYDAADVVVEQRFARSRDGTAVPYFVAGQRKVLARGDAPTVQYGYGGFLIPTLPYYYEDPARPQHGALAGRLWISRGGVLVLANIRGGGEYGPAWHQAALKHNRHRAFDDFFAISEDLIARGITTRDRLGALGRSNGGLLMGVALTRRPDLYAAIDCGVPLLDMLRYDRLLAGASWVGEYGDPDDAADRAYLLSYSPYQNLAEDGDYPEVFFYTSTKDDRVHPGHARKMAARMEALGHPFLYYENIEGGHGGTANQEQLAFRTALEYAFFYRRLMAPATDEPN
jgi:prolyl oligopeptidase